ncbi:metallophosphoesterase family protein [Candidatus Roizmanbacteria bacterium]|nr:MAG: metallophosphoesterase family protein [Candidatus Roizmanbacteria bacterium]
MKTLVISDTHLDLPFDEKKFALLSRIINDADRVIINGDFWEGFLLTFDEFYASEWRNLFPLLKEKQAVYIFGNHDAQEYNDPEKIKEFSIIQTDRYSFRENEFVFIFEHGHRILPLEKTKPDVTDPKFHKIVRKVDALERLFIRYFGSFYQALVSGFNTVVKKRIQHELKDNELFFCGHTHIHEINHKKRFYNTGIIKHGLAQYIYIENGEIIPRKERY